MKPITMMIRIHRLLLRLYPARFYAQFGDEMSDTFAQTLHAAAPHPWLAVWRCFVELVDLPISLLREHAAVWQRRKRMSPPHVRARRLTRVAAIFYCLFFGAILSTEISDMQSMVELAIGITSLAMLPGVALALWRERLGGIALLLTAALNFYAWTFGSGMWALPGLRWLMVLASLIWVAPFVGFGLMFIALSAQPSKTAVTSPEVPS